MAETAVRRRLRRGRLAFAGALVLALLALGVLGWSILQHHDARDDLTAARAQLVTRRQHQSSDAQALHRALQTVSGVDQQLAALGKAPGLADLDQQDLEAVRAAVQAGLAANLAGYNAAVDQRTALDPQHDAMLEQLRQQANAVITAFDGLS